MGCRLRTRACPSSCVHDCHRSGAAGALLGVLVVLHSSCNPLVVWCVFAARVQDIGEDLVSLLHYQERGQLVAVTSSGSAIILARGSSNSTTITATATAPSSSSAGGDSWSVLMRMKVTNAASGSGLQVRQGGNALP